MVGGRDRSRRSSGGTACKGYQKERITAFSTRTRTSSATGWHAHHARIAIGNGGVFGQGFMRGTQNQFLFLPTSTATSRSRSSPRTGASSASLVLVALYGFLVLWCMRVASTAKDRFGAVLAIGVGSLIFWHAFFNLGMVTGLLPVVGVTLPLFSYGGSSVMTVLMGIGLLMNVSMRRFYVSPDAGGSLLLG